MRKRINRGERGRLKYEKGMGKVRRKGGKERE